MNSKQLTEQLQRAATDLLYLTVYRKPEDLARRFGLPIPVVKYWWRESDQNTLTDNSLAQTPKQAKRIRRATQILEGWEKIKRHRPECGALLHNGRKCKNAVAIRPPEGWGYGCLADRCRIHGGHARRTWRKNITEEEDTL